MRLKGKCDLPGMGTPELLRCCRVLHTCNREPVDDFAAGELYMRTLQFSTLPGTDLLMVEWEAVHNDEMTRADPNLGLGDWSPLIEAIEK